jgi:hypothetical protein
MVTSTGVFPNIDAQIGNENQLKNTSWYNSYSEFNESQLLDPGGGNVDQLVALAQLLTRGVQFLISLARGMVGSFGSTVLIFLPGNPTEIKIVIDLITGAIYMLAVSSWVTGRDTQ